MPRARARAQGNKTSPADTQLPSGPSEPAGKVQRASLTQVSPDTPDCAATARTASSTPLSQRAKTSLAAAQLPFGHLACKQGRNARRRFAIARVRSATSSEHSRCDTADTGTQCYLFPGQTIEQIYDSMLDSLSENIEFLKVPVHFDRLTPDAKFALKEYEDWACERIWESKAALAYVAMHADDAMLHSRGRGNQPVVPGGTQVPYAQCVLDGNSRVKVTRQGRSVAVNVCCTDFEPVHPTLDVGVESKFRSTFPIQTGKARLDGRSRQTACFPEKPESQELYSDSSLSDSSLSDDYDMDDYDDFLHTGDFFFGDDDLDDYGSD